MGFRWFAVLISLVVPLAGQAQIEGDLRWSALSTTGRAPHVRLGGVALVVHDAQGGRLMLLSDSLLWTLDLRRGVWAAPRRLVLPPGITEGVFDRGRLVLWNGGVGDVYSWRDGEAGLTREDRSSPHRTQFGHAGFVHPATGDIHAFGGYGFWYYRNHVTRYDWRMREWFLVPLAADSPEPSPRTDALATYWPEGDALFVWGGVTGAREDGRQDPDASTLTTARDLWRYHYPTARWEQVALSRQSPAVARRSPAFDPPTGGNLGAFSALDSTRALWYVAGRRASDEGTVVSSAADLFAVHLRSGELRRIGTLGSASEAPLGVAWDAPRGRLVVLRYAMTTDGLTRPVSVHVASGTDAAAIAMRSESRKGRLGGVLTVLVLAAVVGTALARRGRRSTGARITLKSDLIPPEPIPHAEPAVTLYPSGVARIRGRTVPEMEGRLLGLLAKARHDGQAFVAADVIEAQLWPDLDNPDYVRKVRNQTIRRLSDWLDPHRMNGGPAILSRRAPEDRRRMEYALGDAVGLAFAPGGLVESLAGEPPSPEINRRLG